MNILSQAERESLLKSLSDAPDEILIDAVRQRKDWVSGIKNSFKEVQSFIGMRVTEMPTPKLAPAPTPISTERLNKSPGASTITKIGGKTKDEIIGVLKAGRQPNHDKYGEHLKLLWSREELKYDGKEYYL